MKTLVQPMIFFSAYRADLPVELNEMRHWQLCRDLDSIHRRYLNVAGSYAGKLEQSVAIPVPEAALYKSWLEYARRLGQESIMVRHADGSCYLIFCADGSEAYIGQWHEVPASRAHATDNWSRIGGRYFQAI